MKKNMIKNEKKEEKKNCKQCECNHNKLKQCMITNKNKVYIEMECLECGKTAIGSFYWW